MSATLTRSALAATIDHTLLTPTATEADVRRLVEEAVTHGFASVCVNPVLVAFARGLLDERTTFKSGAGVSPVVDHPKLCAVAAFPLGATTSMGRAIDATQSVKAGAEEIDLVPWLPRLIGRDGPGLRADLIETVRAVRAARAACVVKVILETAALRAAAGSDAEFEAMIESACAAARESGCDYVKTSTGVHPAGGATAEAVRLLKKHANGLKVKASGGIHDYRTAVAMLDAGADRIGASASLAIVAGAPA